MIIYNVPGYLLYKKVESIHHSPNESLPPLLCPLKVFLHRNTGWQVLVTIISIAAPFQCAQLDMSRKGCQPSFVVMRSEVGVLLTVQVVEPALTPARDFLLVF